MIPVRLEVETGELVFEGQIPPFITGPPKVLLWGERVFLLHSEGETIERVRRLERAIAEAGDRHDAERVDELSRELEEAKAVDETAVRLGEPVVYREVFWVTPLPRVVPWASEQ